MKLKYSYRAIADINAIAAYIGQHRPTAAERVGEAIEAAVQHLQDNPGLGINQPGLGARRLGVPRYPYSIYYRLTAYTVEILHVRDDRRKPLAPGDV
jgi:toxin ParE1/3/4